MVEAMLNDSVEKNIEGELEVHPANRAGQFGILESPDCGGQIVMGGLEAPLGSFPGGQFARQYSREVFLVRQMSFPALQTGPGFFRPGRGVQHQFPDGVGVFDGMAGSLIGTNTFQNLP